MKTRCWKTTAAGIIGVATVILTQVGAMLDGNPATVPQWELVTPAVIACIGLLFAKDANVTGGTVQQ